MSTGNDNWDDVLDLELETAERSSGASSSRAATAAEHVQQSVLLRVATGQKPKRGRPPGTTKLVMAQRRAEEEEAQSEG